MRSGTNDPQEFGEVTSCGVMPHKPASRRESCGRLFFDQTGGVAVAAVEQDEDPERGFPGADRKRESCCATLAVAAPERQYAAPTRSSGGVLFCPRRGGT